jgi:hypothetical protein
MSLPVLQKKMRHRSISTTMRSVSVAHQMKRTAADVFVPEIRSYG